MEPVGRKPRRRVWFDVAIAAMLYDDTNVLVLVQRCNNYNAWEYAIRSK